MTETSKLPENIVDSVKSVDKVEFSRLEINLLLSSQLRMFVDLFSK